MRTMLAVLFVLTICVVGFGFYRGWFALSSPSPAAGSNEVNVNLSTNTDKMKADARTVKDKAAELTGNARERTEETDGDRPTDGVTPNQAPTDDGQSPHAAPHAAPPNGH